MHDHYEMARAIKRARACASDPLAQAAICRLEWVLCVAFEDVAAVEDAFEAAYRALTDADDQTAQRFEAASGALEVAYDGWLGASAACGRTFPGPSPGWGRRSGTGGKTPYLLVQNHSTNGRNAR